MNLKDIIFRKKKEVVKEEEIEHPKEMLISEQIEQNEGIKFKL